MITFLLIAIAVLTVGLIYCINRILWLDDRETALLMLLSNKKIFTVDEYGQSLRFVVFKGKET